MNDVYTNPTLRKIERKIRDICKNTTSPVANTVDAIRDDWKQITDDLKCIINIKE